MVRNTITKVTSTFRDFHDCFSRSRKDMAIESMARLQSICEQLVEVRTLSGLDLNAAKKSIITRAGRL